MTEVMRYSGGAGSGVRSARLYGVSKIHIDGGSGRTLCGVRIMGSPRARRLIPDSQDERCRRCARRLPTPVSDTQEER